MIERSIRQPDGNVVRRFYFVSAEENSRMALMKGAELGGLEYIEGLEPPLLTVSLLGANIQGQDLIASGVAYLGRLGRQTSKPIVDTPPL